MFEGIGRTTAVSDLVLSQPKADKSLLFDPRNEISGELLDRMRTNAERVFAPGLINQARTYANIAVIAAGAGLTVDFKTEHIDVIQESYEKVDWYGKVRWGAYLKMIKPAASVNYFDQNPNDLKRFWAENTAHGKWFDNGDVSDVDLFLHRSFLFRLLYPNDEMKVIPSESGWLRIYNSFDRIAAAKHQIDGLDARVYQATILADLKWSFPEHFEKYKIPHDTKSFWKQKVKSLQSDATLEGFHPLASALTLLSAEHIEFKQDRLSISFPGEFMLDDYPLPKRRIF